MTKIPALSHEFVSSIPAALEEAVVYVSIPYATAVHLCCCGCKNEVVTPITPTDWELIFDGETISLYPSVGNWAFACRSHYWIRRNRVVWAARWSQKRIDAKRAAERTAKDDYFSRRLAETAVMPGGSKRKSAAKRD